MNQSIDRVDAINSPRLNIVRSLDELCNFEVDYYDALYYFAWMGNSGSERGDLLLQQENIIAVCSVMKKLKRLQCDKFIFAGSIMEYEAFSSMNIRDVHPGLGNIYSASKLVADIYLKTLALKYDITYICLLISNIYGPGERNSRLINTTIRKILNGEKTAFSTGTQLYDFIYIDDAIDKFIILGEYANSGSYYIGNPTQKPLKDYIRIIGDVCGRKEEEMGIGLLGESMQIIDYGMINTGEFEELFDHYNKVGFREGILRTKERIKSEVKDEGIRV